MNKLINIDELYESSNPRVARVAYQIVQTNKKVKTNETLLCGRYKCYVYEVDSA